MLKFLRKYNKSILVVGGVLLMIAFLLPSTLNRIGREQANRTVAKMDGRSVSAMTLARAQQDISIVENTLLDLKLRDAFGIENAAHWEMLAREAKAGGFVGGAGQAETVIAAIAPAIAQARIRQFAPEMRTQEIYEQLQKSAVDAMRSRLAELTGKAGSQMVDEAMARFAGITLMREFYNRAARVSEPEARVIGHDFLDRVDVDASAIRADDLIASVPEPAGAEQEKQFEAFKRVAPGSGELGFGYLQPAAVKVEWLTLDRGALTRLITPDPVDVRKRWQSSRDKHPGEFAAEKERVEAELKAEQVAQAMREADQIVRAEIAQELKRLPDDGRWKAVPANWQESARGLAAISNAVREKLKARGIDYAPTIAARLKWLASADLRTTPGLGDATLPIGARKFPLPEMYPEVKEIGGKEARGPQVGVLAGPAIDNGGNYHYFRLMEARPEGPPATLDEVRTEVVRDLKDVAAYDLLAAKGPELLAKAQASGLSAIAGDYPSAIVAHGGLSRRLSQFSPARPALNVPEFRDAVMGLTEKLDPTKPVADAPPASRFVVVPLRKSLTVAVAEVKGLVPLTVEEFQASVMEISNAARTRSDLPPIDNPYTYKRMKERHAYVTVGKQGKDDAQDEEQADGAAKPARSATGG